MITPPKPRDSDRSHSAIPLPPPTKPFILNTAAAPPPVDLAPPFPPPS